MIEPDVSDELLRMKKLVLSILHDAQESMQDARAYVPVNGTLAETEARAIAHALTQAKGNREKAAKMLGIGERTIYRKIKKYGIHYRK